jgi:hypothetical protein
MAYEQFFGSQEHLGGWRCIFCGETVDHVILENREGLNTGAMLINKNCKDLIYQIQYVNSKSTISGVI